MTPGTGNLVNLLPYLAIGWLCLGVVVYGVRRLRRPTSFETLGRVFMTSTSFDSGDADLAAALLLHGLSLG